MIYLDRIKELICAIEKQKNLNQGSIQLIEQNNKNKGEFLIQLFEREYPANKENILKASCIL